jgi:hypothetical protein
LVSYCEIAHSHILTLKSELWSTAPLQKLREAVVNIDFYSYVPRHLWPSERPSPLATDKKPDRWHKNLFRFSLLNYRWHCYHWSKLEWHTTNKLIDVIKAIYTHAHIHTVDNIKRKSSDNNRNGFEGSRVREKKGSPLCHGGIQEHWLAPTSAIPGDGPIQIKFAPL